MLETKREKRRVISQSCSSIGKSRSPLNALLLTILLLTLFSGCGSDFIELREDSFMTLHNIVKIEASKDCNDRNMEFLTIDLESFNHYSYYCYTSSPVKHYKFESDI